MQERLKLLGATEYNIRLNNENGKIISGNQRMD